MRVIFSICLIILLIQLCSSCGKEARVIMSEKLICNRIGYGHGEIVRCLSNHFQCDRSELSVEMICNFNALEGDLK